MQEDATKRVAIREEECSIQSFTISENIENIVEEVLDSIDYPAESKLPEVPKMDYEYLIDTYVNKDEWMVDADVSPDKRVQYEKTLGELILILMILSSSIPHGNFKIHILVITL